MASAAIPPQEAGERLARYEIMLERQFYRALDQLERLQRRRLGDFVPPPIRLDVSGGS